MAGFATIDVGSNSVLIYIAKKGCEGNWAILAEKAKITRLGRSFMWTVSSSVIEVSVTV